MKMYHYWLIGLLAESGDLNLSEYSLRLVWQVIA